jgi:RES domain
MSCDIEAASPSGTLHRIGRRPDPWAWPDWSRANPDGTFGNRYDDPGGEYRVLYASSDRRGAYLEVLARYRADPAVRRELGEIEVEPGQADLDGPEPGRLPRSWLDQRVIGTARADAQFAAVGHTRSLAYLRDHLADRGLHYKIPELDASAIRLSVPRAFTQEISRLVFECATATGGPQFAGINYRSRLGDEIENWAIFEPAIGDPPLSQRSADPIDPDDPDLHAALELHGNRTLLASARRFGPPRAERPLTSRLRGPLVQALIAKSA